MRVYTGKVLGAFLGFVTLGVVGGLVGFFCGSHVRLRLGSRDPDDRSGWPPRTAARIF